MLLMSFNLKSNKTKRFLALAFLLILCAAALVISPMLKKANTLESDIDYSESPAREFFLNMHKLDVEQIDSREIIIPKEFSSKYTEYNQMMKNAGYNLEKFKGENAVLYTYEVKNLDRENIRASITVCENRIIAADIYLFEQNGFIEALE